MKKASSKFIALLIVFALIITLPIAGDTLAKKKKNKKAKRMKKRQKIEKLLKKPDVVKDKDEFYRQNKGEAYPDLTTSTITHDATAANPGEVIRVTISLNNTGNAKATDIDIFNDLDYWFEAPTNFKYKNCGKKKKLNGEDALEISNLRVKKKKPCVIKYQTALKADYSGFGIGLKNDLYISPASEGGVEIGPIAAPAIAEELPQSQPTAAPQEKAMDELDVPAEEKSPTEESSEEESQEEPAQEEESPQPEAEGDQEEPVAEEPAQAESEVIEASPEEA